MGTSSSSLRTTRTRPLTIVSSVDDWKADRSEDEISNDENDSFNHPRLRRLLILQSLLMENYSKIKHISTTSAEDGLKVYESTHSLGLLNFLESAWDQWEALGNERRDPGGWSPEFKGDASIQIPPLVPTNMPLHRDSLCQQQRPSSHVLGQVGFYCTDTATPVFRELKQELYLDAAVLQRVLALVQLLNVEEMTVPPVLYALTTHPGHHAAHDCFGGYCYLNNIAALANHLKKSHGPVAILDVDYHCGNGTASIFASDMNVLVVSLHCHPDYDYPFHSGFECETGIGDGKGTTLHLPMSPGMEWNQYSFILDKGLAKIRNFGSRICLVSLGLDTYVDDPCTLRGAGFALQGDDYVNMGKSIAKNLQGLPLVIVQEGGYRMDKVGDAAANFVLGCCSER